VLFRSVRWHIDFDIGLAHYLLDENDAHDLEHIASQLFGAPIWDIPLEEKQGAASLIKIVEYHGHDLYYTRNAYFPLKAELEKDSKLLRVFKKLMMPLCNLFVDIEANGCHIDLTKMADAEEFLRSQLIFSDKNKPISSKALRKWEVKHGALNWASPKQVAALLYDKLGLDCPLRTGKGAPSTSESALTQLDHPCVQDLLDFRYHKQQLSFFIEGWKPYLVDSRIHPSVKLHGTTTGRPACEHPNFYQVPRDSRIRSLIDAPPGYDLIEADLSQAELRIIAEYSGDPEMRRCFLEGIDIHWRTALGEIERGAGYADLVKRTAAKLSGFHHDYGESIEILLKAGSKAAAKADNRWNTLDLRNKAKPINFGYSFKMWWERLITYARDDFGIILTSKQAQASRKAFFDTYPKIEKWHERQEGLVRAQGFMRSPTGRLRRLPDAAAAHYSFEVGEAQRQAINFIPQSFANDINFMVLLQICEEFPDRSIFCPYITVYDSIIGECRHDYTERVVSRLEQIMRRPALFDAFGLNLSTPIEGDVKIGNWSLGISLTEWKEQQRTRK
jgi:DNA polymerase-1